VIHKILTSSISASLFSSDYSAAIGSEVMSLSEVYRITNADFDRIFGDISCSTSEMFGLRNLT
jgi:hypothetical protein